MGVYTFICLALAAHPGALPPSSPPGPVVGVNGVDTVESATWVAKKRKRRRKKPKAVEPIQVTTPGAHLQVQTKRARRDAFYFEAGQEITATLKGSGKLALVLYPVTPKNKGSIAGRVTLDGNSKGSMNHMGLYDPGKKVYGSVTPKLGKSKKLIISVGSGKHTVTVEASDSSGPGVVAFEFYPSGSRTSAPVLVEKVAPPAPGVATAPADFEEVPLPGLSAPALSADPIPEAPKAPEVVALEKRFESGEVRHGLLKSYDSVQLTSKSEPAEEYLLITSEKGLVFMADGPGVVTIRMYPINPPADGVTLAVLENDILLRTLELKDAKAEDGATVEGHPEWVLGAPGEYKLTLGQSVSRFQLEPDDAANDGVAMRYTFEPEEKNDTMALSLDLVGMSSADLGGGTVFTEVAVREKVVEKIVEVGEKRKETVGIAVGGGGVVPAWGGVAPSVQLEFQYILPFAEQLMALSVEGGFTRYQLESQGLDSGLQVIESEAEIWAIPLRAGPSFRFGLTDRLRLNVGARAVFTYANAKSRARGGESKDTAGAFGASVLGALEIRVGVGWWSIDAGYLYSTQPNLDTAITGFRPGGFEFGTRFRFVI